MSLSLESRPEWGVGGPVPGPCLWPPEMIEGNTAVCARDERSLESALSLP